MIICPTLNRFPDIFAFFLKPENPNLHLGLVLGGKGTRPYHFSTPSGADCVTVPFCKPRSVAPSLECRNQHWFLDLQDAAIKINTWRQDYNQVRPHESIDNRVPMDLLKPTGFLTF